MLGAIAGDIIGSVFEFANHRSRDFPLFSSGSHYTDDTILTLATADCLLTGASYASKFKDYYYRFPYHGYGGRYSQWVRSDSLAPYNSFGNGSAMRVSPVAYAFDNLEAVLAEAKRSAETTHNHPEGIKGAQTVAGAIFLARQSNDKSAIKEWIRDNFGYDLSPSLEEVRRTNTFDETCQGTVPQCLIVFFASQSFEDAIRNAISIGGDSDTIACIVGSIAEAFFGGVPQAIAQSALRLLPPALQEVTQKFVTKYLARLYLPEKFFLNLLDFSLI